jgi:outer membrane immunogenic protein
MRHSHILAIAALGFSLGLGGFAHAADLPASVYKARPVAPAAWTWNGFYVGGNVGYGWLRSTDEITGADAASATFLVNNGVATSLPLDSNGLLGGIQAGYNWQTLPNWVIGIEADIDATDFHDSLTLPGTGGRPMTASERMNWLGTVRGRVGFTPANRWLVYATGGLAYGRVSVSDAMSNISGCAGNNCQAGSASAWRTGWAAGGGAEWAFSNDWTVRIEYLHFDLGTLSHPMVDPAFPFVFTARAGFEGDIVRVGINRLFR